MKSVKTTTCAMLSIMLVMMTRAVFASFTSPLQAPIISTDITTSSSQKTKLTVKELLADLSFFTQEAFDVDYMSLDLDSHRDNKTLLTVFTYVSDQLDHLEAARPYAENSDPVRHEDDVLAVQDAIVLWEQQFKWEAADLTLFGPDVAKYLHQVDVSLFVARRMSAIFESYAIAISSLVPDDNLENLERTRLAALAKIETFVRELEKVA